jgi:uncharacterized protein
MLKPGYIDFAANGAHFVYDSHTNGVVGIDPSVREILDDYFRLGREGVETAHAAIPKAVLHRSIQFVEDAIHDVGLFQPLSTINFSRVLSLDEFNAEMESGLPTLTLNVTEQCNQFCSYCPLTDARRSQPNESHPEMTWEIAKNSLDCYLALTSARRVVKVVFFGGEPLLNWELIQKCLRHVRGSYASRDIQVQLVSNLTLLKKSILETLIDFGVQLQVSFDGPQPIHDGARFFRNGRGSYQVICDRLAEIRALSPDYLRNNILLHCTFNRQNDILEVFRHFSEWRFSELPVRLRYVTGSFLSPEHATRHEERIEQLIEMYLAALRNKSGFRYDLFWNLLRDPLMFGNRALGPESDPSWPNGACAPGAHRLFVSSGGTFYPCENCCAEGCDIGDHKTGFEFSKAQALFRTYSDVCQETCQGCWAHRLCTLCYISMISGAGVDPSVKAEKCDRQRGRILKALRRFVYIWENEPPECHDDPSSLHFQLREKSGPAQL